MGLFHQHGQPYHLKITGSLTRYHPVILRSCATLSKNLGLVLFDHRFAVFRNTTQFAFTCLGISRPPVSAIAPGLGPLYQNLVAPSHCLRWPLTGRATKPGGPCLGSHLFRLPELKVVTSNVSEFDKASRLQPEVRVITYTTPCSPILYFFGIPAWPNHRPRPLFS